MNKTQLILRTMCAATILLSCTTEQPVSPDAVPAGKFMITASHEAFRTTVDNEGVVRWMAGDQLGVVAAGGTSNVQFSTSAEQLVDGGSAAHFIGDALSAGRHFAYSPYQAVAPTTLANALSLAGQKQIGANSDHIGAYNLLLSNAVEVKEGDVKADFALRYTLNMYEIELYLATAQDDVQVTGVTFMAHAAGDTNITYNIFAQGVHFDPSTGVAVGSKLASKLKLTVENSPVLGVGAASSVKFRMMMLPKTIDKDYVISVFIETTQGSFIATAIKSVTAGHEFETGKIYSESIEVGELTPEMLFPDINFRKVLTKTYGMTFTANGAVDQSKINNIAILNLTTYLSIFDYNISDLTGISYFKSLTDLSCSNNMLETLDLTSMPNLTDLDCRLNRLTALDLTPVSNLSNLQCDYNQLTTLDLMSTPKLMMFSCENNKIADINLKPVPNLIWLSISNNLLQTLDLSFVPNLMMLYCSSNQLATLDLTPVPNILLLYCYQNQLTVLTMPSSMPYIGDLKCYGNKLITLDLPQNRSIKDLQCHDNALTMLDLRNVVVANPTIIEKSNFSVGKQTTDSITVTMPTAYETMWNSYWKSNDNNINVTAIFAD